MATPHNRAANGEIAKTVLMPGDPLRAKWIAEIYLADVQLVSDVRNVYCYTGQYKGVTVSVMASGMGMPSIGIYSYELYKFYDVENIIRIGSAGAYTDKLKVLDVVLADAVWSESTYGQAQSLDMKNWQYPSEELNRQIKDTALKMNKKLVSGPIHSSDVFIMKRMPMMYFARWLMKRGCFALRWNPLRCSTTQKCLAGMQLVC